jgi:diguanylate cyclase (GGDEF)-like protein/PAS domain S-box-containing protein
MTRDDDPAPLSSDFYQELLETAPDGIVVVDDQGTIRAVNRQAELLLAWDRGHIVGQPLEVLIPIGASAIHPHHRDSFMAAPTTRPMAAGSNLNARRSDGSEVPVDISLSPVPVGDVVWVSAAIRDATARMAAEDALRRANDQLTATVAALERRGREMALINEMGDLFQSCLTTEEAAGVIATFSGRAFPDTAVAVYLVHPPSQQLSLERLPGTDRTAPALIPAHECLALRHLRSFRSTAELACPHILAQGAAGAMCLPLVDKDVVLGLVSFLERDRRGQSRPLDESLTRLAPAITEHISLALANVRLREALHVRSIQDALTGLFNRRHFDEMIETAVGDAEDGGEPLAVLAIDVDDFKGFNDSNGHRAGDLLLQQVADAIRACVRPADLVFRTGGDEFVVVLPSTTAETAVRRAEAFCETVKLRDDLPVTVSVGVATLPHDGATRQALLDAADAALYQAKNAGRDRVCLAGSPPVPTPAPVPPQVPLPAASWG